MIISGGSNIYPREVEEVLLRHPGVREVAAVGRRDPEWGETPVAFVVDEGADALCLAHVARYKRPRECRFAGSLPKSACGKVLKTLPRERFEAGATGVPVDAAGRGADGGGSPATGS